jgi:hypothetical protein
VKTSRTWKGRDMVGVVERIGLFEVGVVWMLLYTPVESLLMVCVMRSPSLIIGGCLPINADHVYVHLLGVRSLSL